MRTRCAAFDASSQGWSSKGQVCVNGKRNRPPWSFSGPRVVFPLIFLLLMMPMVVELKALQDVCTITFTFEKTLCHSNVWAVLGIFVSTMVPVLQIWLVIHFFKHLCQRVYVILAQLFTGLLLLHLLHLLEPPFLPLITKILRNEELEIII